MLHFFYLKITFPSSQGLDKQTERGDSTRLEMP
jgi:hypothetical protein